MKWFKFYGADYLIDPKILSLSPAERSCWITLLCYASNNNDDNNDNGMIHYLDEEKLMIQAGLDITKDEWDETKGILKKLENLKMIRLDNEVITLLNWQKRQKMNLTGYERVKRWREKKRLDNAMITSDKNRIDKIRKEEKRIFSSYKEKLTAYENAERWGEKPFYKEDEMRWSNKKWWVLQGKEWLEFNGKFEEIEWR